MSADDDLFNIQRMDGVFDRGSFTSVGGSVGGDDVSGVANDEEFAGICVND